MHFQYFFIFFPQMLLTYWAILLPPAGSGGGDGRTEKYTPMHVLTEKTIISVLYIDVYFLFCNELLSHSIDSSNPSPFVALALNIWKVLFFSLSSPRAPWTSVTDMAPSMSCLLARTTKMASLSSSSSSIETSSCLLIPIRSLSALSTT